MDKYQAAAKLEKILLLAENDWLSINFTKEYEVLVKDVIEIYRQYLSFESNPDSAISIAIARCYSTLIKSGSKLFPLTELELLLKEAEEFIIEIPVSIIQAEFYAVLCFIMINYSEYKRAVEYGKIAIKLIGKQKLTQELKYFYSNYGLALIYLSKFQEAQEVLATGLVINDSADRRIAEKLHMHLGLLYRNQQNFQHALDEFLIAEKLHSSDDISGTVILNINIASIYTYIGEYRRVLEILSRNFPLADANELDPSGKKNFLQSFNLYIGSAIAIGDYKSSREGLELMEHYIVEYNDESIMEDFYRLAADEACAREDFEKARFIYEKAFSLSNHKNPVSYFFQQAFVNFLIYREDYQRALEINDLIIAKLKDDEPDQILISTYKNRVKIYKGLKKYREALELLERVTDLESELAVNDLKQQVDNLLVKTQKQKQQLQEKEKRISLFNQNFINKHNINFVGTSNAIKTVIEKASIAAQHPGINVLISGESGTGKELIAKYIHYSSDVDRSVFQEVNCSAIPDSMLESEFFGYKKGAFTGALRDNPGFINAAHNGTLFLDEIGDLPLNLQPKLLKVLEEKEVTPLGSNNAIKVNFRLISATNQNLNEMVNEKTFRRDLFNRINSLIIEIPPLRQRTSDIMALTDHFLNNFTREFNLVKPEIDHESKELLLSYHYPGNVRELRNILERTMIFVRQGVSFSDALRDHGFMQNSISEANFEDKKESLFQTDTLKLEEVEKQLIIEALHITGNRKNKAAILLDITPSSLSRRLKKYDLRI